MFSILDFIFMAVTAVFLIWGLFRGLFKEIVTTLGALGAYWVANQYYGAVAPEMRYWLNDPALMSTAAYFLLFVGTFVLAWFLSWVLARAFRIMPPAWVEFPGGALFGAVKGALICSMALVSLNSFLPDSAFVRDSRLAPHLKVVTDLLEGRLPEHMRSFDPSILGERLKQESEEYRAKMLGSGAPDPEQQKKKAEEARKEEDKGVSSEVLEMKDKILKGVQEMMDKEKK